MKLIRNSRAQLDLSIYSIGLVILAGAFFIALSMKNVQYNERPFSEAFRLMSVMVNTEKAVSFITNSADYSVRNSIHFLENKGGLLNAECGEDYDGYRLWNSKYRGCYPSSEKIKAVILSDTKAKFEESLKFYPVQIPNMEYVYTLENKEDGETLELTA